MIFAQSLGGRFTPVRAARNNRYNPRSRDLPPRDQPAQAAFERNRPFVEQFNPRRQVPTSRRESSDLGRRAGHISQAAS
jgi:hypothetical protein